MSEEEKYSNYVFPKEDILIVTVSDWMGEIITGIQITREDLPNLIQEHFSRMFNEMQEWFDEKSAATPNKNSRHTH